MNEYVLGAAVEFDLDDIWEYIAADNTDAADRWIAKLFNAFEALGHAPGLGHRREDLTAYPVLFWPVGAYLVIYRVGATPVETPWLKDACSVLVRVTTAGDHRQ